MTEIVEVVIRQPGFPDRIVPLQEGRTRLGRADDNEIVLSDVGVSRRHAAIVLSNGDVSVEDLGSGNGTYYFGHRIKSQPIRDQDEVVIDPFILRFRVSGNGDPNSIGPPTVPVDVPGNVRLDVVVGNGMAGSSFNVTEAGLTMGRAEDRDVVLPDAASSRHHCHITLEGEEFVLHDNGSANGVFVNAVRVRECTLSDGDLLRIGNTEMRFVNGDAANDTPAPWIPPGDTKPIDEPHVDMPMTPARISRSVAPKKRGRGMGMAVAAASGLAVVGMLAVAVIAVAIALGLWFTAPNDAITKIPARPPTWKVDLPPNLPESDSDTLFREGTAATKQGDYALALENFYRVLKGSPENRMAKKFATFSAEVMVAGAMEAELTVAEDIRLKREKLRTDLIRNLGHRRRTARTRALSALKKDFRDDLVVQERMQWSMTDRQRDVRERIDRLEKYLQTDEFGEASRLGLKLLETTTEPDLREKVHEFLAAAEAAQARKVGAAWREGVLAEALDDKALAMERYKMVIEAHPTNPSAKLRLATLEPGR